MRDDARGHDVGSLLRTYIEKKVERTGKRKGKEEGKQTTFSFLKLCTHSSYLILSSSSSYSLLFLFLLKNRNDSLISANYKISELHEYGTYVILTKEICTYPAQIVSSDTQDVYYN